MTWANTLIQESKIKSCLILDGNVRDEFHIEKSGKYALLPEFLIDLYSQNDWELILRWDSVKGLQFIDQQDARKYDDLLNMQAEEVEEDEYDMGDEENMNIREFPLIKVIKLDQLIEEYRIVINHSTKPVVLLCNWTDFIFGNTQHLTDDERQQVMRLGTYSLESTLKEKILSRELKQSANPIILITSNVATIPHSLYQPDPRIRVITVTKPDLNERRDFLRRHFDDFQIQFNPEKENSNRVIEDLAAHTDMLTTSDLRMLLELSNKSKNLLHPSKLVNIYKFGEKPSPWEQLNDAMLKDLKKSLNSRVLGQEKPIEKVVNTIIKASLGISGLQHSAKKTKPKGTLFFTGPTGVGKTELAKGIAKSLFGDESAFIRFDMSEFKQEEADQRLIGAPPGYVGFENGGQLTNAVMEKPFSVLLFDEIEKANSRIFDIFLGILEDGRLTDGRGETAYFSETLIIFTSNLGATTEASGNLKEKDRDTHYKNTIEKLFVTELKRPEILNRIGENIVVFNSIDNPEFQEKILRLKLKPLANHITEKWGVKFRLNKSVYKFIIQNTDPKYGGRGILNIAEKLLMDPLSEFLFENKNELKQGKIIFGDYDDEDKSIYFDMSDV